MAALIVDTPIHCRTIDRVTAGSESRQPFTKANAAEQRSFLISCDALESFN